MAVSRSEESGRTLQQIIEREIEPSVKQLSTALLSPTGLRTELEECVAKFESALERMRLPRTSEAQSRVAHLKKLRHSEFPAE